MAWQLAHTGLPRCCSIFARSEVGSPAGSFSSSGGTFGGGAGGGAPRMFSSIHLPRSTTDVRFAYEVIVRTLACPSRPWRRSSSSTTRRKRLPYTPSMP